MANFVSWTFPNKTAREMFPGKGNSLDALCRRLEVDNSKRDLHGALIDADLLAQVYLNMTRGQDSLVIDSSDSRQGPVVTATVNLSELVLPVLTADADELAANQKVLLEVDKASKGKAVWQPAASA